MAEMSLERLTEFAEARNKSDPDLVASYFTDDGSFFSSAGPDPLGRGYHGKVVMRQAARDFDARYSGAQFPNLAGGEDAGSSGPKKCTCGRRSERGYSNDPVPP